MKFVPKCEPMLFPSTEVSMDPRYARARSSLTTAILKLCAKRAPEDVSVSELTKEAGVSRGTFYAHASCPAELLANCLLLEIHGFFPQLGNLLSESRENYLLRWREIYIELLEHIAGHGEVYRHIFLNVPASVTRGYFGDYFQRYLRRYVLDYVNYSGESLGELWVEMAVEQQVQNTFVIIQAWLKDGMKSSPEVAINTFMSLAAPWQFTKFDQPGHILNRRRHAIEQMLVEKKS